tara:strand:- start:27 stop:281 length:255 start_codon:yes stop_codon:yes gene_type:complete
MSADRNSKFPKYIKSFFSSYELKIRKEETILQQTLTDNDLLIDLDSSNTAPVAPVLDCLSLPAKSTKFNLPDVVTPLVVFVDSQ